MCVVGLGYVGLPLALILSKKFKVIGFDINSKRIEELKRGFDKTGEILAETIERSSIEFSSDEEIIKDCSLIIVAVPTPVDKLKNPDLNFVKSASKLVGRNLSKGSIVVYESTVWPGLTEEVCIPILESESGLRWMKDFNVGYSPERVNPGDKEHSIENVIKVVSADCEEVAELLCKIYGSVIKAGVYKASSIKTAEAAKVIENIQRDLNIALMNELAIIFHRLGLDTKEVFDTAATKWNFLRFEPGLVGGHCIGVDPYYLTYKAKEAGYTPQLILAGRGINEYIPRFVAEETVKLMIKNDKKVKNGKILILGFSFKENVSDVRNTKVFDLYNELREFGLKVYVYDPIADREDTESEYNLKLIPKPEKFKPYEAVLVAVKHREFIEKINLLYIDRLSTKPPILVDIKGIFDKREASALGIIYWRL
ncbi:MAG: nucleotide sugar dehydrogenase [Thermodesulfovibrio sp.]|nr:nucleotide sugar dehydrogenase [Thermodesulfovibrio sp.]